MIAGLQVSLRGARGALNLDVRFSAPPGITALIGPSGAGKSTLLRAIAGLDRLVGTIRLDQTIWQDATRFLPPHRRHAGTMVQTAALLPHLSAAANLAYATRRSGATQADHAAIVALLDLAPLLARWPDQLSGGERKRVALGRALLTRPLLLLLDEPLAGLGHDAQARLLPKLARHFAAMAVPVLYVSHDLDEVRHLTGRILTLSAGQLIPPPPPSPPACAAAAPRAGSAETPPAPAPPPDPC